MVRGHSAVGRLARYRADVMSLHTGCAAPTEDANETSFWSASRPVGSAWRRNEINTVGARRARSRKGWAGLGFSGRGGITVNALPTGGRCISSSSGVRGEAPAAKSFGEFCDSSGDRSCSPAVQNCV